MSPSPQAQAALPAQRAVVNQAGQVMMSQQSAIPGRKMVNRKHIMILKLVLTWLVLTGIIALAARWLGSDEVVSKTKEPDEVYLGPVERLHSQDQELLDEAVPACRQVLSDFMAAGNNTRRLELVCDPEKVRERLSRYYTVKAPMSTDVDQLEILGSTVVHLPRPEGDAVLIQWESIHGLRFDTAFRQVGRDWKLDWDHYVRYSEHDWALFLAGSGPEVAEFRLLARERYAFDGAGAQQYSVMLYAPEMKRFDDAGLKAVMSPMSPDSTNTKMLRAAFKFEREGIPLFRSAMRDINPQDMVRVRVVVRRIPGAGRHRFEIEDVKACHWYSSEAWGVLPKDAGEDDRPVDEERPTRPVLE